VFPSLSLIQFNAPNSLSKLSLFCTSGNQKGVSYSPRSFKIVSAFVFIRSSPLLKVAAATATLVSTPLLLLYGNIPGSTILEFAKALVNGWDALMHFSIYPLAVFTLLLSFYFAHFRGQGQGLCYKKCDTGSQGQHKSAKRCCKVCACATAHKAAQIVVLLFSLSISITSQLQIIKPSWIWNPFLWGNYKVYQPADVQLASEGLCLDNNPSESRAREPLCLSNDSWNVLSSGALSSKNAADVKTVLDGISYVRNQSGGIIINVMSRDTIDSIKPLRQNIEGLLLFFPKLSVVVFENDSIDGSRDAFKQWGKEAKGYDVDVMECEDAPDCKFGVSHRYDATEATDYFRSSAIGNMAKYRQRMVDYILSNHKYDDYSHMIVIDLDLCISLSPLGVLHSLGMMPENPVASSGRQVWPGSFGTLVPPYDFTAFRPHVTKSNEHLVKLHKKFCALMPPGDRWRNVCDAVSPMQLVQILAHDRAGNEMYRVDSAFNGGTMYPLKLTRETHAQYDEGDDGQRCEHIAFNLSLQKPMYVNPKWDMHISPSRPGGPTGARALKSIVRIVFTPRLSLLLIFVSLGCIALFVFSVMALGMHLIYPLCIKGIVRRRIKSTPLPLLDTRIQLQSELDFMGLAPKRKLSDFAAVKHV